MFCNAQPHVFFLHVSMISVLLFVPVQLWFLPEYHGNFAIEQAGLPKTQNELDSSDQKKLGIMLKYPYMHFVASDLNDKNDHNMASIRHARGGSVVGELTFNVHDFYNIKDKTSGTSVAKMCDQVKEFTFEWSDNWQLFVPGCSQVADDLDAPKTAAASWDLKTGTTALATPDAKKVHTCYKSVRSYTRNAMGQKIVWAFSVVVYALMLARRDPKLREFYFAIMLSVFLVFMICQGLQFNFLGKVENDGCFGHRFAEVVDIVKVQGVSPDGGTTPAEHRDVKAYDWFFKSNLQRYLDGESFTSGLPNIEEQAASTIKTFSPNVVILWTNIAFSILGVILILYEFRVHDGTAVVFTQSFMM